MDILTFSVGLLIGLFPVVVDMGGHLGTARLRLDGLIVCEVSAKAPACLVDLGPDPKVHSLDLERLDGDRHVVEEIHRWVNRPGVDAKLRATGACGPTHPECEFHIEWAHPARLDPSTLTAALDGHPVSTAVESTIRFQFPKDRHPQILTFEAGFPDGTHAALTETLHGDFPASAQVSLRSVILEASSRGIAQKSTASNLAKAGVNVKALDEGPGELLFIVEPQAFRDRSNMIAEVSSRPRRFGSLQDFAVHHILLANESLSSVEVVTNRSHDSPQTTGVSWAQLLIDASLQSVDLRTRMSDAVAVAGYRMGALPRRRLAILVLGDQRLANDHSDEGEFDPSQAQEYLREIQVPLVVWRIGSRSAPEWPLGPVIESAADLADAATQARAQLDRQRVAWVGDEITLDEFASRLPAGLTVAGQPAPPRSARLNQTPATLLTRSPFRDVFSVASDPTTDSLLVGAREGLFESQDTGASWRPCSAAVTGSVFAVVVAGQARAAVIAAGPTTLGPVCATHPTRSVPGAFAMVTDPAAPLVIYASTGDILKSIDGGVTWRRVSRGLARVFAASLGIDPALPKALYAGTAGDGLFYSLDGGSTWVSTGRDLRQMVIRCLLIRSTALYAGTDGGLFASSDAGVHFSRVRGFPHTIVYTLVAHPTTSLLLAGTSSGLYISVDSGRSWAPAVDTLRATSIPSITFVGTRIIIGTIGAGVVVVELRDLSPSPIAAAHRIRLPG